MATNFSSETVGVIDVGSNTIKLLIATRGNDTPVRTVDFIVEETRIGEGMTGEPPSIDDDAIARGSQAIARLVEAGKRCDTFCIVATSAVRDASNKQAFVSAVEKASGHELRVLSGDEEAMLISRGIQCDPELSSLKSYSLLDLGGGSLECIQISKGELLNEESLPLGSVRLASKFLQNRAAPLSREDQRRIEDFVHQSWIQSRFRYDSCPARIAILTGGAAKHLATSLREDQLANGLAHAEFVKKKDQICSATLSERVDKHGIPKSRADIFPTAVATLDASLRYLGCDLIYFSEYNLRYGVAATLLAHGALSLGSPKKTRL